MEIKETCKHQRTLENYVRHIARQMAQIPTAAWDDILDYVYFLRWWEAREKEDPLAVFRCRSWCDQ